MHRHLPSGDTAKVLISPRRIIRVLLGLAIGMTIVAVIDLIAVRKATWQSQDRQENIARELAP